MLLRHCVKTTMIERCYRKTILRALVTSADPDQTEPPNNLIWSRTSHVVIKETFNKIDELCTSESYRIDAQIDIY